MNCNKNTRIFLNNNKIIMLIYPNNFQKLKPCTYIARISAHIFTDVNRAAKDTVFFAGYTILLDPSHIIKKIKNC